MNKFADFNADLKIHSLLNPRIYKLFTFSLFLRTNESCLFCGIDAFQKEESGKDYMRVLEIEDVNCQTGVSEIRITPICEDCSVICSKIIEIQRKRDEMRF